jgi:homoserine O-acetyltransferase
VPTLPLHRTITTVCAQGSCAAGGENGSASARTALGHPDARVFSVGGHVLESGVTLPAEADLVYAVHGEEHLQPGGSGKVVLHPTSFDATHLDLTYQIGPGAALDTSEYAVIVPNLLGNGVSYSPSRATAAAGGGGDRVAPYPSVITIDDNVRMQRALLTAGLGLDLGASPLALVYGYSMGGMQALSWARLFPDEVQACGVRLQTGFCTRGCH